VCKAFYKPTNIQKEKTISMNYYIIIILCSAGILGGTIVIKERNKEVVVNTLEKEEKKSTTQSAITVIKWGKDVQDHLRSTGEISKYCIVTEAFVKWSEPNNKYSSKLYTFVKDCTIEEHKLIYSVLWNSLKAAAKDLESGKLKLNSK